LNDWNGPRPGNVWSGARAWAELREGIEALLVKIGVPLPARLHTIVQIPSDFVA
jgi:hypothetical protein